MPCSSAPSFASFAVSASSRTAMNASNAGLRVEPLVLVDLVRPDRRLDARVELHPRHVARVVVVAEEGVGAARQERLQRRLRRQRGRLAQQVGRARQLALVLDAVGHDLEPGLAALAGRPARMVVKNPVACARSRLRQRLQPRLDVGLGRAGRVEVRAFRLGRHAGDERLVVVEPVPGPLVDQEVVQCGPGRAASGRSSRFEQHRLRCRPRPAAGTARP